MNESSTVEQIVCFDNRFPHRANALWMDEDGSLYLANGDYKQRVQFGKSFIPIEEATPDLFEPVSLKQALEWFVETEELSDGSYQGAAYTLCRMAAEALPEH